MKIAQVAALDERVVSYLTQELVAEGHEVTVFETGVRLVAPCAEAPRLEQFDIVHFHVDGVPDAMARRLTVPNVTTFHGRLDSTADRDFGALVSISRAQRDPRPDANWVATIHEGLPLDLHERGPGGDYLAFVGRIAAETRVDRAIEIAASAGLRIKIAAKVDRADRDYHQRIEPLLDRPHVEFLGELGARDTSELLRNARALVFPIDWPEPFGRVMIDAMACGTPVIAFRAGATPEVVDDGVTGFVVESIPEAVRAVARLDQISRTAVRRTFEQRFSAARMARDYVHVYEQLAGAAHRREQPRQVTDLCPS